MIYLCIKCNKRFSSNYILNKHINRKYPCDTNLSCLKCCKVFKVQYDLDRHLNRKYSCVPLVDNKRLELTLQIEKERNIIINKQLELQLKSLDVKATAVVQKVIQSYTFIIFLIYLSYKKLNYILKINYI